MPAKSPKPDYEFSPKTNQDVKTGKLRQREYADRTKQGFGRLARVLGVPSDIPRQQVLSVAADTLVNQPSGGLAWEVLHLAYHFLEPLEYSLGTVRPLAKYWEVFTRLVKQQDADFAEDLLRGGYEHCFRWLVFGHVQRLSVLYHQRPDAMKDVEFYENDAGKVTKIAVCNDGSWFVLTDDRYDERPNVLFPGDWFTLPFHPDDLKRLESLPKLIWVPPPPEPLQPGPTELVHETLIANVGLPEEFGSAFLQRIKLFPFPATVAALRASRASSDASS